jgi:large subunit ribosomal protein L21
MRTNLQEKVQWAMEPWPPETRTRLPEAARGTKHDLRSGKGRTAQPRRPDLAGTGREPDPGAQKTGVIGPGIAHFTRPGRQFSLFLPSAGDFWDSFFFLSWNSRNFAALISITMLAVVKIAGQQFKVQKDQTLFVPRIAGNAGDKVEFGEVLLSHGDSFAIGKDVKAVIQAEIIEHLQGDKVIAFKMKRRKGFRKKHGHRTHYTKIRINEIA